MNIRQWKRRGIEFSVATCCVLLGFALRKATNSFFTDYGFPFICFFPAVLAAAITTSLWPSLYASGLSILLSWYYFIYPSHTFQSISATDFFAVCFFAAVLTVDCLVIAVAKRSMKQLKFAEAELRTADKRKDEFLAFLAHELRNPLHILKNVTTILRAKADPGLAPRIDMQERQVLHMQRLVADLLDSARLNSGKIHVEYQPLQLNTLVSDTVEAFRLVAAERRQTIELHGTAKAVGVVGDESRLRQVIENLLSNASKFAPPESSIEVRLTTDAKCASVAVTDRGAGIDEENLDRIFGMYVQSTSDDTKKGGLGLGLPLARHIAERLNGSLKAYSDGPGLGATFTLSLPIARPAALDDQV